MTPYERGYAAGLKAAAGLCQKVASRHLAMSDYQAATALECKGEILSEPIVGEATNPGEQECVMVPVKPTEKMRDAVRMIVDEIPPYIGLTGNALNEQIWKAVKVVLAAAKEEHDAHR